jgi:putative transposase
VGQRLTRTIEWLTDNGSGYIAQETRSFAREIGLEPCTTPIESPPSNGMAEAFVRTIKRDYVRLSSLPDAQSGLRQLPGWLAHYNEVHPPTPFPSAGCRREPDRSTPPSSMAPR